MISYAQYVIPREGEIRLVLDQLAHGPQLVSQLVVGIGPDRRREVFRGLIWLVKLGVLRLAA